MVLQLKFWIHDKARQNRHNLEKILERPDMQVAALN